MNNHATESAVALGLRVHEAQTLWDVDEPADLARLAGHGRAGPSS